MEQNSIPASMTQRLRENPHTWLVTGAAGFVGSHLVEHLLQLEQRVVGLDNFSNGTRINLENVQSKLGPFWKNFEFIEGDIRSLSDCRKACERAEIILHQAALGSVPRSISNPIATNDSNVTGFLNLITTAKDLEIRRFVYASSSSVYGDNTDLPKVESRLGKPLSPYAVSKVANELYAKTFSDVYGIETVGLRYFNVFGPRQLVNSPYAAVIPKWIHAILSGNVVQIFGDGTTSRDFCYVKNVVQMNLLAALTEDARALNRIFNTACNKKTSLIDLFHKLKSAISRRLPGLKPAMVEHFPLRQGDIQHSQAFIEDAELFLNYQPRYDVSMGLEETVDWYISQR